jgi:hypothetical protein
LDESVSGSTLTLRHWNGTRDDTCVRVTLTVAPAGESPTVRTNDAPLSSGKFNLIPFSESLRFAPVFNLPGDGGSSAVAVPMTVSGIRARVVFNDAMTEIVVPATPNNASASMIGGYVLYPGTDTRAFRPALEAAFMSTGSSLVPALLESIPKFLDLDSTPGPGLSACTSSGGGGTSADSFSIALLMSGHQVTTP